mgnify:FL=1
MNKRAILDNVDKLIIMYKNGEVMPEDVNSNLEKNTRIYSR